MISQKTRGSICGFAALYMWYIAYQLYQGIGTETTMSPVVSWIFIVFFAIAGIGLAVIAYKQYKTPEPEENPEEKDTDSLK